MGPLLSVAGAAAIAFSELHLKYLFGLRDYSKTPFTLALIGLLGAMVVGRPSWRRTLAIAAGYGAVLGIGYGFRTDFLIDVPPFVLATLFFLPGGLAHNLRLKAAAIATCLVTFNVVGYPVIRYSANLALWMPVPRRRDGICLDFQRPLGVLPAPYDVSREYLDEYAFTEVTSYAARVKPGIGHIGFCEPEYGSATRDFLSRSPAAFRPTSWFAPTPQCSGSSNCRSVRFLATMTRTGGCPTMQPATASAWRS